MIPDGDDDVVPQTSTVEEALDLAALAHAGQRDKSGALYIDHLRRVSAGAMRFAKELGDPVVVQLSGIVGALHDIIEDTPNDRSALSQRGVPQRAIDAIELLTHARGEHRGTYVARLANDPLACAVKLADNADNADPERLARLGSQLRERLREKYALDRQILEPAWRDHCARARRTDPDGEAAVQGRATR